MHIIGFSGLPGSGKSTAIAAVKDLGIVVTMGDVVRLEAKIRKVEPTSENLGKIARELREKEGDEIIAVKCVDLIKEKSQNVVFVDGIRSLKEVEVFRLHWEFPLIAVILDRETRYNRLKDRRRSDDPLSFEEFLQREKREIKFGIKNVIASSDFIVRNESDSESLQKEIRKIVLNIIRKS